MKCNLLHINLKKCCYMYFNPKRSDNNDCDDDDELTLALNGTIVKQVSETKFLGVIIDNKLSWTPHLKALNSKLKRECGRLYSIKRNIPKHLHNQLYHTLFESHLSFGISVWGGVSDAKLEPIFITQKKCVRIMFGDNDAYSDKFKTCLRARPYEKQKLGKEFYELEPSEPLFVKEKLLTVYNLYKYHCILELFKIIKFRQPISMYSLFTRSRRRDDLLITPTPSTLFVYKSSSLWNNCRKQSSRLDFTTSIGIIKTNVKKALLVTQKRYGLEWHDFSF